MSSLSTTTPIAAAGRRWASFPPPVVFLLLAIPLVIELSGVFLPAVQGVGLSFTQWNGLGEPEFVGVDNYVSMLGDGIFMTALRNTALWLVFFGSISFVAGLTVALLLQSERRGVTIYRVVLFLPVVFSFVVTALIWTAIFQPDGIINGVLEAVGLGDLSRVWLGDPDTALFAVLVAALWREIGYVMVLFIAGLKSIDQSTLEAGRMDGANYLQRFRYIVFPQLRNINLVVLSVIIIDSLRSFDIVWAMTGGGPFHSTELLSTYMFSAAFQQRSLGYASAIAVIIVVLALGFIISYLSRALSEEKES